MTDSRFLYSFVLVLVTGLLYASWSDYTWKRKYKLPAGPRGLPYFGNMFQMPPGHQGPWAKELAEKYGDMFTIRIASNTWVFLNTSQTTNDLLEKRSAIYSSRPRFPFASTLLSDDCRMVIQPYGPQWRSIRKIMHTCLNICKAATFAPFQDLESKQLLYEYLENEGNDWWRANQRFANSVIMSVVFGKRMRMDDPNVDLLFDTSRDFILALQPAANLVDTFYLLDLLPNALKWWRNKGLRLHEKVVNVYKTEVADLKRRIEQGICRPCFATKFLDNPETGKVGEKQTLFALGSLMEAGSDTSRMTISQIVGAAATDMSWVRKARKEMDAECRTASGQLRLPEFADREKLPYISAVVSGQGIFPLATVCGNWGASYAYQGR